MYIKIDAIQSNSQTKLPIIVRIMFTVVALGPVTC